MFKARSRFKERSGAAQSRGALIDNADSGRINNNPDHVDRSRHGKTICVITSPSHNSNGLRPSHPRLDTVISQPEPRHHLMLVYTLSKPIKLGSCQLFSFRASSDLAILRPRNNIDVESYVGLLMHGMQALRVSPSFGSKDRGTNTVRYVASTPMISFLCEASSLLKYADAVSRNRT